MSEDIKTEDLFSRTWKTVVVLVGACVLFVGALSTTAVLITNKAVEPRHSDTNETPAETPAAKTPAKKPVSI
jgi:hypothetical protein